MSIQEEHIYTLTELNTDIRATLEDAMSQQYWVCAEISELHHNRNGHCYLELIDKDTKGRTTARQRAVIWSNTFNLLRPYFEQETGQAFVAGIKVLVLVTVTYHELYGLSLTIYDINPSYTIGEAARRRAEILAQLERDGIINDNKELPMPMLLQRIAVVSSGTAAGYGDFIKQLTSNSYGYIYYPALFQAVMQGERTEASVIDALNRINARIEQFDCVVIIRGGGSTAELSSFDTYPLACNVAQFPIPVIVGIGHDRDETILDHVAAIRVKTPTAAAEWLIEHNRLAECAAQAARQQIVDIVKNRLLLEHNRLLQLSRNVPYMAMRRTLSEAQKLQTITHDIVRHTQQHISVQTNKLALYSHIIPNQAITLLQTRQQQLDNVAHSIKLLSPDAVLARGYSLIVNNNKVVRTVNELPVDSHVELQLADGTVQAQIVNNNKTTE